MRSWGALCLVPVALGIAGCGSLADREAGAGEGDGRTGGRVLARDADYTVVLAQKGDDLASLAERYLGDAGKAWWIAEWNGIDAVRAGQDIVIPSRPRNPLGIGPTTIQTVPVLCYHRFGARGKLSVTPAAFEQQMEYLAKNGYRVITLAQLAAFLAGNEPLPKRSVVITIDDGYRSTYDVAFPILKRYGFPATVFLYTDFVGLPDALTWAQMQEMMRSGLVEIQPHSKSHANLTLRLPRETDAQYRERLRSEVESPIATIRTRLGAGSQAFAYPYGDVTESVADMLARGNVRLGFTVTPGGNPFFAYPLMLRRTMIYGEDDLAGFRAKLAVSSPRPAR